MAENTREIILDTLLSIEREGQFSNQLVRAVLDKYDYLDVREKAFFKRVTEGTIERQIELDYYLNHFSSVPVRKMKPLIRVLLRMSVYQLLYMDSVPDSAVCNEACKLAAKRKFGNLKGFINGVLRSIARSKDNMPLPDKQKKPTEYLSVKYSMPEWILNLWERTYGYEATERIVAGLLDIHPVAIRFRTDLSEIETERLEKSLTDAGVLLKQSAYLPYCYTMEHVENIQRLPGFAEGLWTVQDVSSALAVEMADIKPGDFVLDACAAPGGKSILAAEKAAPSGTVSARDVSEDKVALIEENAERMRSTNLSAKVQDARETDAENLGKADVVLLDVPCSGLGIMGKKRDIKYHVTPESAAGLVDLSKEIVKTCVDYLKPGGTLLYSTCTIRRAENEEMVHFLTKELALEPVSIKDRLPKRLLEEKLTADEMAGREPETLLQREEQECCIQLLPGFMDTDGFFIAKFKKPVQ